MYVSRRLIDSTAALDYPAEKLEIQVLDDSTDETAGVAEQAVNYWRQRGVNITHVRRGSREGFKAGALAYGMDRTGAEYIAIFDADFIPRRDFLRRTVPVLYADNGLSFVQTRWGHTNRSHSLLAFLQSLSIDGHFAVEQYSRWKLGYFFNFNGHGRRLAQGGDDRRGRLARRNPDRGPRPIGAGLSARLARRLRSRRRIARGAAGQLRRLPASAASLGPRQPGVCLQVRADHLALHADVVAEGPDDVAPHRLFDSSADARAGCPLPAARPRGDTLSGVAVAVRVHGRVSTSPASPLRSCSA